MKKEYLKEEVKIIIGNNVRTIRKQKGLTQEKFSEEIDVSVQFLSALEREIYGLSLKTMIKICNAMDCTPLELYANLSNEDE